MDIPASPRDQHGRFVNGNPGGPGRPRNRSHTLRHASEDAITPDHVAAIMRRATRMALEGDLGAMKFVIERTCGRVAETPAEGIALDLALPRMRTAADCALAIERLVEAICNGTCDLASAKVLIDMVNARLKAIEVTDLETRLAELENTAKTVDLPGSRGMRRL